MKITYDKTQDNAYIYLKSISLGEATKTVTPIDMDNFHFDFNSKGQLIGIEVEMASRNLPAEFLSKSKIV